MNFEEIQNSFNIAQKFGYWNILKRFRIWIRLKVHLLHGRDRQCPHGSSDPLDKSKNTCLLRLRTFSWRRCHYHLQKQLKDGKVKWQKFSNVRFFWRITGNRWRSNWIRVEYLRQDLRHCKFFRKSRMICKNETLNLRSLQTGSSSCQCSTILIGQEKETMRFVFRIQK